MKHVVLFSGGIGSWAAAKRITTNPEDELVLLFTDTNMEDEDLYRFITEAATDVGGTLVRLADGRTPWELFFDEKFIGNTRVDICSRVLKRDLSRKWIEENCDPADTIVYLGVDWSEIHRYERAAPRWKPYRLLAPLCDPPYLSKTDMLEQARDAGLTPPRLYELGFPHNNCGGFCVKQGQAAFLHLLKVLPERYAHHEEQENLFRSTINGNVAILRDRRGGVTKPLTLTELRIRAAEQPDQLDLFDWGGCGCMVD